MKKKVYLKSGGYKIIEVGVELPDEIFTDLYCPSYSRLKHLEKSPRHYQMSYLLEQERTEAMDFGNFYHIMVLEPERFENFRPFEEWCPLSERPDKKAKTLRSVENTLWVQKREAEAKKQGITLYPLKWLEPAMDMREVLMENEMIQLFIEAEGVFEYQDIQYDEETGIVYKRKVDKRIPRLETILDLKTAKDASPWQEDFPKSAYNFRYHRQAPMYIDNDDECNNFFMIVQEKSPPYAVAFYMAGPRLLEAGRIEQRTGYKSLFNMMKRCRIEHGNEFFFETVKKYRGGKLLVDEQGEPLTEKRPMNLWPSYEYWRKFDQNPWGAFELTPPYYINI